MPGAPPFATLSVTFKSMATTVNPGNPNHVAAALEEAKRYAKAVTDGLRSGRIRGGTLHQGGRSALQRGFCPHDTGMVTKISQDLSQFALRRSCTSWACLSSIRQFGPSASSVILVEGESETFPLATWIRLLPNSTPNSVFSASPG